MIGSGFQKNFFFFQISIYYHQLCSTTISANFSLVLYATPGEGQMCVFKGLLESGRMTWRDPLEVRGLVRKVSQVCRDLHVEWGGWQSWKEIKMIKFGDLLLGIDRDLENKI